MKASVIQVTAQLLSEPMNVWVDVLIESLTEWMETEVQARPERG